MKEKDTQSVAKKRRIPGWCGMAASLIAGILIGVVLGKALPATEDRQVKGGEEAGTGSTTAILMDTPTADHTSSPEKTPMETAAPVPTSTQEESMETPPVSSNSPSPIDTEEDETNSPEYTAMPAESSISPEESAVPANPMTQPETEKEEKLPLSGVKIGIDPGHQEKGNSDKEPVYPGSSETKAKVSSGTQGVSTRVPEYEVNLQVALLLRSALDEQGAEVFMTREMNEIDISNVERATMMNEIGVDLVLRLHCNGSTDNSVRGISLFVKPDGEGAEESYKACEALMPAMLAATDAKNQGIHKRDTYSGLNWSTVPSILVEMGFMSNPEEDELLNDPTYQQKLVDGMVQGIADYMERELDADTEE